MILTIIRSEHRKLMRGGGAERAVCTLFFLDGMGRASGVFRKSSRGYNPKRAHLVTLSACGRKGATGAQCAAGRLQEKSKGVLADGAFDK